MFSRQCSMSTTSEACSPGRRTMLTITSSSLCSEATGKAATSGTEECLRMICSTSNDEIQVAVFVEIAAVAGVEPEIAPRARRGLRHVVVALRVEPGHRRSHQDLAGLAARHFEVVVVGDEDLDMLAGLAAGSPFLWRILRPARGHHAAIG